MTYSFLADFPIFILYHLPDSNFPYGSRELNPSTFSVIITSSRKGLKQCGLYPEPKKLLQGCACDLVRSTESLQHFKRREYFPRFFKKQNLLKEITIVLMHVIKEK